jgi:hypothetical protein
MSAFVSRLFEPIVVLPVTIIVLVSRFAGLPAAALLRFFLFFFLGIFVPIVVFRVLLLKRWGVAWDIPHRRDRVIPMILLATFFGIGYALLVLWGNAFLNALFGTFLVWFGGFLAITLFYKISGHVAADAFAAFLIVSQFGFAWWPVLLVIPLVAWARVRGKHHTQGQVIAGAAYSLFISLIANRFL